MAPLDKVKFVYDFFPKEQYAPEYTSVHKAPLTTFDLDSIWMEISEMFVFKNVTFFWQMWWWWDVSCFHVLFWLLKLGLQWCFPVYVPIISFHFVVATLIRMNTASGPGTWSGQSEKVGDIVQTLHQGLEWCRYREVVACCTKIVAPQLWLYRWICLSRSCVIYAMFLFHHLISCKSDLNPRHPLKSFEQICDGRRV